MGELADIEAKSPIEVMFPGKNAIFINIEPLKYDYIYIILEINITIMIILILSISTLLLVLVIMIT